MIIARQYNYKDPPESIFIQSLKGLYDCGIVGGENKKGVATANIISFHRIGGDFNQSLLGHTLVS